MKRIRISELKQHVGEVVKIAGFVHELRNQSKVKFVLIRELSGIIQCVSVPESKTFLKLKDVSKESVVEIIGEVKEEKQAPGGIEIQIHELNVLSVAEELPIQVVEKGKEAALPVRLDYRWIDLRKPKKALIFKIWTTMEKAMREYWAKNNFIQIHSPKFVEGATESGAEVFTLDYFGKTASLAQSPQFYKQMAMAAGLEKVFEIGPVFRANKSHTTRHDTEFTSIDMEVSFIESEEDLMRIEEEWIVYFFSKIKEVHGEEIKKLFGIDLVVPKLPFPRITIEESLKILKKEFNYIIKDFDLDSEGEKLISKYVFEKYNHDFVFLTEYPIQARPFYHMRLDGKTKSFDLVFKGVEITTGAQREHNYETLKKQAIEKNISLKEINHYLEFFKYGCPPHGGLGLSPSRVVMLMLDLKNVKEATFVPRDTERLTP